MPLAGVAAGLLVGNIVSPVISTFIGPTLAPYTRQQQYQANFDAPNLAPSMEDILRLHSLGVITFDNVAEWMQYHGAPVKVPASVVRYLWWNGTEPENTGTQRLWQRVVEFNQIRLPLDVCFAAYMRGDWTARELEVQARLNGITSTVLTNIWQDRHDLPNLAETARQYFIDKLAEGIADSNGKVGVGTAFPFNLTHWTKVEQAAKNAGIRQNSRDVLVSATVPPTIESVKELYISGRVSEASARYLLAANDCYKSPIQDLHLQSARDRVIPPVGDLIRFQVKEAFSFDIARDHKLYSEYPDDIDQFTAIKGIAERNISVPPGIIEGDKVSWSQVYWASHWQPISPSQAYSMLHRLRPSNIPGFQRQGLNVSPFNISDVQRWLRVNDYPPTIRDNLAAISYHPLRLVDIRKGIRNGSILEPEAIERYQDLGYDLETARRIYKLETDAKNESDKQWLKPVLSSSRRRYVQRILQSFDDGIISYETASAAMQSEGVPQADALTLLAHNRREQQWRDWKLTRNELQRAFDLGSIADDELVGRLVSIGVLVNEAEETAKRWKLRRNFPRKAASVATIQRWVADGHLSYDEAFTRLRNLGHSDPDAAIYLDEAKAREDALGAHLLSAHDRDARLRFKALSAHQRELERQRKQTEKELRKVRPLATLKRWLKREVISSATFRRELLKQGYSGDDIANYEREVFGGEVSEPTETATASETTEPGETEGS